MRLSIALALIGLVGVTASAQDWPRFRGPDGSGISVATDVPLTWDATTNVRWRTPLPGPGTSSPVLFRDRVYLTCYTGYGVDPDEPGDAANLKRHLLCIKRADGAIVWDRPAPSKTPEPDHGGYTALHGYASSTPAVDADGVYVYYGASGLAAYGHDGKLKWEKSCGTARHDNWGSAASPVLYKNLVIIHADVESESIFAFDRKTGRPAWKRTFKPEGNNIQHTRSTPLVMTGPDGRDLLVIHSRMNWVSALDPATGETRWEYQGTREYQNPSPVTDGDLVYVMTYLKTVALRPADGTEAWAFPDGSEICTPIIHAGHLYWASEQGIAYCVNAKTGKSVYQQPLARGRIYASGVLAEGRLYYVSREEGTFVLPAEPRFDRLAHNAIADDASVFNATPALADGRIYLRSDRFLYCIGK